jgi:hypothetical protein
VSQQGLCNQISEQSSKDVAVQTKKSDNHIKFIVQDANELFQQRICNITAYAGEFNRKIHAYEIDCHQYAASEIKKIINCPLLSVHVHPCETTSLHGTSY